MTIETEPRADAPLAERESPLFVASLEKAMQVLGALAEAGQPLSLADLARITGLGRSAVQRFAFTLKALGYLVQDELTRKYLLSARMMEFGEAYSGVSAVQDIAYPILEAVNTQCQETVNLTVLDGMEVVYVLRFPSHHVVSVNLRIGSRLPIFCSAPGRAMLAHLPLDEVRQAVASSPLVKMTEFTETEPDAVMMRIRAAHGLGYAINDQEAFLGDISVAAAVRNRKGQPVAAVNIAVPTPRWTAEKVESELGPLVKKAAENISALLGWKAG